MRFRGFWGRVRRAALAAIVGAALSFLAAQLIAFALLDIIFQNWARLFYAAVYLAGAGILFWLDDDMLMKVYRVPLASIFGATGVICLGLVYTLQPGSPVPMLARAAMFAFVGMTLCISVVLSCFVIAYMVLETSCQHGDWLLDALSSPGRIVWICIVALLEGIYFGLVLGVLEHRDHRHRYVRLPKADMELALPMAALLGGIAGARIEWLRQACSNHYITLQGAPCDGEDELEAWAFQDMDEESHDGAGVGNFFDD